jgi:carboxypeptidase Q
MTRGPGILLCGRLAHVAGILAVLSCIAVPAPAGSPPADSVARQLLRAGLTQNTAYTLLAELTHTCGSRLSGSPGAARAVELTAAMMRRFGFVNVRAESCMVPHWVRGTPEEAVLIPRRGAARPLAVAALGGSIGTPRAGITAEVLEVHSFDELRAAGSRAAGKIVFFNRPMDPTLLNTFAGYGGAVDQRVGGAIQAARVGAVAAIVRSVTTKHDNVPHTGSMSYQDSVPKVPAVAIGVRDAELLSDAITRDPHTRVRIRLACETLPDAPSANVMGELRGSQWPDEVIVIGGHLDCWDKGVGAHDDGSGCMQAIEAVRLLKELGVTPKRTIRAVMFMNEENGSRGGKAYAVDPHRAAERAYAAIEADRGGFMPRGFTVQADSGVVRRVKGWAPLLELVGAGEVVPGHGGVDITPIVQAGAAGFGLVVDNQRYFDVHHSANDVLEAVHPRELELGAIAGALLAWLLSEEGL